MIGEEDCSIHCGGFGARGGLKRSNEVNIWVLHGLRLEWGERTHCKTKYPPSPAGGDENQPTFSDPRPVPYENQPTRVTRCPTWSGGVWWAMSEAV